MTNDEPQGPLLAQTGQLQRSVRQMTCAYVQPLQHDHHHEVMVALRAEWERQNRNIPQLCG